MTPTRPSAPYYMLYYYHSVQWSVSPRVAMPTSLLAITAVSNNEWKSIKQKNPHNSMPYGPRHSPRTSFEELRFILLNRLSHPIIIFSIKTVLFQTLLYSLIYTPYHIPYLPFVASEILQSILGINNI